MPVEDGSTWRGPYKYLTGDMILESQQPIIIVICTFAHNVGNCDSLIVEFL